jgi:hypothetical protein
MRTKNHAGIGIPTVCALILGTSILVAGAAGAQELSGGVPGEWLSRYTSARTAGVGGAFVATANEPLGLLWNPAGLTRMNRNEIHFETARLFEDTRIQGLGFAVPGRRLPSVGLAVISLRSGDFEKTNDLNEPLGSFHEGDLAFLVSASKQVTSRLALGANFKIVRQSIDEFDGSGFGTDLGALFEVTPTLRLGASLLNVGGPRIKLRETDDTHPVETRGGVAWRFLSGKGIVSAEIDHRDGPGVTFHSGTEFWLHPSMALRVGYSDTAPAGGFSYVVSPDWRLDYGLSDHELGVTHRIGISYRFGGFFADSRAHPRVFSPLGVQAVTKFELEAHTKADVNRWALEIVDKQDQVVRHFGGSGSPPSHVMWDGKDEVGLPLPDGLYRYQLTVRDDQGAELVAHERLVEITTEGPQGSVPVLLD